ncbi:A/G-specific adenine glycosylase [Halorubrum distributum JCM 13561]|uniref:A/G-specific adenine glycosylase n=1 Tax=Halorubrum distributum JCM 13561 TaxID=1227483 RepID=M0NMI9_9EURY|nr:hypothetical protein [Halorubrum litoreum]EMA58813.1 A/G-specific adenine glycosylase [Halorubrum litoreum JCM 13561]
MPAVESRVWNNAVMELGGVACGKSPSCDEAGCPWREWCHAYQTGDFTAPGVACGKSPSCDEAGCPWREWCHAYQTGDFTAPDVPEQPGLEGSGRQFRRRIVRLLGERGRGRRVAPSLRRVVDGGPSAR